MTSATSTKEVFKNQQYLLFILIGFLAVVGIGYFIHKHLEAFTGTTTATTTKAKLFDIEYNTTTTTTTVPNVVKSGTITSQRGNVIYYATKGGHTVNPISESSEYGTKDMKNVITISLGADNQPFTIKQILVTTFHNDVYWDMKLNKQYTYITDDVYKGKDPYKTFTNESTLIAELLRNGTLQKKPCNVRVSAVDTKNNQVQFAGLTYNLVNQGEQLGTNGSLEASEIMYNRITQLANPGSGIYLDDVKTMFGTDLIGNKINIFTNSDSVTAASIGNIIITGYSETQKISLDQLQNTPDTSLAPSGKQVVIRAIRLKDGSEGAKFRLTYTSPYSNNLFTYPGPVDGQFIYTKNAPIIYLSKMLLTNQAPKITSSASGNLAIDQYNYSDQVSQGDVTRFRMENNLTDLRGSINPEYVCPDIQGLISKHLDAETIVDSIEYLDKINTEKVKLSSNKDNLLTLLEQEEDIKKLEAMVKKIRELQAKRTQETDALAALQFTKQMNEVIRLRESIEQRIAQRNRNRLDIEVNVTDADAAAAAGTPDSRDTYKIG